MCLTDCRAGSAGLARAFPTASGPAARLLRRSLPAVVAVLFSIGCGSDPTDPDDSGLALSITTHDFGAMAVGGHSSVLVVTVSNTGARPTGTLSVALTGPTSDDFALPRDECSGVQLPGGSTCVVEVEVVPTTLGLRQATLTISEPGGARATASLSGTGSSSGLNLSPTVVTFGETAVGQTGALKTVLVRNTASVASGTLAVTLTGGTAAAFTITRDVCSGTSLQQGASCAIDLRFIPPAGGSHTATLSVSGAAAPSRSVQLLGYAGEPATLTVTPTGSHAFGARQVGNSGPSVTFTIANTGTQPTGALEVRVTGTNPTDFQVAAFGCYPTLAAGATCTVEVNFVPTAVGTRAALVSLTDPFGTNATISVTGEAIPGPPEPTTLTLSPGGSFAFAPTLIAAPVSQLVTVTNPGSSATGPLNTSVLVCDYYYYYGCYPSPGFSLDQDDCEGVSLAPGGSCTVAVVFTPSFVGIETAQFDVYAPGFLGTLALSGTGTGLHTSVTAVSFAPTPVGGASASQTVVITNTGPIPTGSLVVEVSGFVFKIVSNTCAGVSLQAGGFCTVAVRFEPTSPGSRFGALGVSATPGGTIQLQLSGVGL